MSAIEKTHSINESNSHPSVINKTPDEAAEGFKPIELHRTGSAPEEKYVRLYNKEYGNFGVLDSKINRDARTDEEYKRNIRIIRFYEILSAIEMLFLTLLTLVVLGLAAVAAFYIVVFVLWLVAALFAWYMRLCTGNAFTHFDAIAIYLRSILPF